MKKLLFFCIGTLVMATACKKTYRNLSGGTADVQVINMAIDVPSIQLNMNGQPFVYRTEAKVAYGASAFYFAKRAQNSFTVVNAADSTKFIAGGNVNFTGTMYTIYIAGKSPNIDTVVREETNYPFIASDKIYTGADSVVNIRFANMSPNSVPVKINVKGSATNEVASLPYKGIIPFKAYAAKPANTSYVFEVRDAGTNALLLTYTFSVTATNRFKNVALVLKGLQGTTTGTNAYGIAAINYF